MSDARRRRTKATVKPRVENQQENSSNALPASHSVRASRYVPSAKENLCVLAAHAICGINYGLNDWFSPVALIYSEIWWRLRVWLV